MTAPEPQIALRVDPSCAQCSYSIRKAQAGGKAHLGCLFEMKPGSDGLPWYLCARCFLDGLRPGAPAGVVEVEHKQR